MSDRAITQLGDGVVVSRGIEWCPQEVGGRLISHDEYSIALNCYFRYNQLLARGANLGSRLEEWRRLVSTFWPEPVFVHSRYTDLIFDALINHSHCSFIGMTTAGKTSCVALWCLLHFEWYRDEYGASFFSVNEVKLRETAFKELSRYCANASCPMFGKRDITHMAILSSDNADSIGIRCRPLKIETDPIAEITSMAGVHGNKIHDIILEEANACRESIFAAALNIQAGTSGSKIICNANPVELGDTPLSRFHMPVGGYEGFDIMTPNCQQYGCSYCTRWETISGVAIRFDGRDSPGIEDPVRYHFNLRQETIDQYERTKHISPMVRDYYNIIMGWPRAVSAKVTTSLLTEHDESRVRRDAPPGRIIHDLFGIDTSFQGQDPMVCAHIKVIETEGGARVLHIENIIEIGGSTNDDVEKYKRAAETIAQYIKGQTSRVTEKHIGVDVTNGGYMFPEAIAAALRLPRLPTGVSWSMWSDERTSFLDNKSTPSRSVCYDRATEIYTLMRDYVRNNMLTASFSSGVEIFLRQARKRYYVPEGKMGKLWIEPKRQYKAREGASPDHLDAVCIACMLARDNFKIYPQKADARENAGPAKKFVDMVFKMQQKRSAKPRICST